MSWSRLTFCSCLGPNIRKECNRRTGRGCQLLHSSLRLQLIYSCNQWIHSQRSHNIPDTRTQMLWLTYRHIRSRSYCCRRRNFHRVYITVSRNNLCNRFLVAGLGTCCTPCSSDIVTCRHCYRSNHHLYYCSWSLYFLMTGECDVVSRFIKEAWRIGMTYHPSCNRSCCFCRHNGRRQGISWRRNLCHRGTCDLRQGLCIHT